MMYDESGNEKQKTVSTISNICPFKRLPWEQIDMKLDFKMEKITINDTNNTSYAYATVYRHDCEIRLGQIDFR